MTKRGLKPQPKQKLKTHKGAKKRFKITATGLILRTKGMKSHNRRKKARRASPKSERWRLAGAGSPAGARPTRGLESTTGAGRLTCT